MKRAAVAAFVTLLALAAVSVPQAAGAASARCDPAVLTARVSGSGPARGTLYQDLVLTNSSGRACTLHGFPAITFLSRAHGRPVGVKARQNYWTQHAKTVTLAPRGGIAVVRLDVGQTANYVGDGSDPTTCDPVDTRGIDIVLPGATRHLYAHFATSVCAVRVHQFGASYLLSERTTRDHRWQP